MWQWKQRYRRTPNQIKGPGIDALIEAVRGCAGDCERQEEGTPQFILRIAEDFAFIRLADLKRPLRFLKQLSGNPPQQFGTRGFKPEIVDDSNPARHYTAFVFVGYWLPMPLGILVLYAWEILGFVRYGWRWSPKDVTCGWIGLQHGRAVRRNGAGVLAELIARDLRENGQVV